MQRNDIVGRLLGIIVFLGGVGLLAFVFSIAYSLFTTDVVGTQAATGPAVAQLGKTAINLLARIAVLIVMTIVGSLIASRGIQLYFASGERRDAKREIMADIAE